MKITRLLQLGAALATLPLGVACAADDTHTQETAQLNHEDAHIELVHAVFDHNAPRLERLLQAHPFHIKELSRYLAVAASTLGDGTPASPECVRLLLAAGADPGCTDFGEKTPLMVVMRDSSRYDSGGQEALECARLLLAAGADVNAQDENGKTPLIYATGGWGSFLKDCHANTECIRLLLEAGAEINDRDTYGYTALMWVCETHQCEEAVRLLLEAGADATVATPDGLNALHLAARDGEPEVIRMLTAAGLELDATDPVMILRAAKGGNTEWVAWLVEHGADVNTKGPHNETPIIRAASGGHVECVRWLMEHGADIHAVTTDGETALAWLAVRKEDAAMELMEELLRRGANPNPSLKGKQFIPLVWAVKEHNARAAVRLLLEHGAHVNDYGEYDDYYSCPALFAAASGDGPEDLEIVRLLLAAGADVNKTWNDNESPLHIAAEKGKTGTIGLLLAAGAVVDARNGYGQTPLMIAARECNPEAVRALLAAGADVRLQDYAHRTVLLHAVRGGHSGTVKLLLEAGADVNAADPLGRTPLMIARREEHKHLEKLLLEYGATEKKGDDEE